MHEHNNGISRRDLFKFEASQRRRGRQGTGVMRRRDGLAGSASTTSTTDETTHGCRAPAHRHAQLPDRARAITDVRDKDYDVVVIGAGASGVPAALSAFEAGAKVALLQRNRRPSRRTRAAASTWPPATRRHRQPRIAADRRQQHRPNRELVELWAQNSGRLK
ncbi:MAG: FAD-dependent oxidoreductase [Eggerthella lenta]